MPRGDAVQVGFSVPKNSDEGQRFQQAAIEKEVVDGQREKTALLLFSSLSLFRAQQLTRHSSKTTPHIHDRISALSRPALRPSAGVRAQPLPTSSNAASRSSSSSTAAAAASAVDVSRFVFSFSKFVLLNLCCLRESDLLEDSSTRIEKKEKRKESFDGSNSKERKKSWLAIDKGDLYFFSRPQQPKKKT